MSIQIKKSHRGRFTEYKKRTGKTTEQALHSKNKHVRAMARFAKAARKWKHEDGGLLSGFDPISFGLNALTAIGGAVGANMETERAEMYEDAAENMQMVDINKATKNSGLQSFLQNPLSLGIGGRKRAKLEAEEFNENILKQIRNKNISNRFSTMSDAPTYTPVARQGGFIAYKGQTHDGPDGGILVDKFGNPTAISQEDSVASVEGGGKNKKGEVSYYDPELGSTYIYSDSLKFAKPARRLLNKYKLDKPESLQYKQYKNDLLTQTMIKKQFENLTTAQEFAKETDSSMEDSVNIFKKGGYLSSSKAKEMLRDGTAHGKKLTAKQKRYFGWIASGRKEEGGELLKKTTLMPKENLQYDRDLMVNQGWMNSLKSAKDLNELYNTNVGTWKGNPMTLQQFSEMPEYVTNYYNPNYAIEFNKNRLGLPNTFQDINLGKTKIDEYAPTYQPAYTVKPQNNVAYYRKGGYVPMYEKGKDDYEELTPFEKKLLQRQQKIQAFLRNKVNPFINRAGERLTNLMPSEEFYNSSSVARGPGEIGGSTGTFYPNILTKQIKFKEDELSQPNTWTYIGGKLKNNFSVPTEQINRVSKPAITRQTLDRVGYPEFNIPDFYTNSPEIIKTPLYQPDGGDVQIALNKLRGEEEYNSWLNPAGHILSAVGSLADYNAMKKARPENVNLGRVGAERISLAKQRLSNIRNTATAKAMATSAARSSGMNAGVALSNTLAANTGANRLLGQQNAELLEKEETTNAQMRQQANMINAELAAQEGLFNTQQQNAYRMMMAQNNPLGNLARTAASYFADNAAYQQGYDTLQMLAPNAELYRDTNTKWKKNPFARPKVRLR